MVAAGLCLSVIWVREVGGVDWQIAKNLTGLSDDGRADETVRTVLLWVVS